MAEAAKEEVLVVDISQMTVADVAAWLKDTKMDKYVKEFAESGVDGAALAYIDEPTLAELLAELGCSPLDRIRIRANINRLKKTGMRIMASPTPARSASFFMVS